MTIVLLSVNGSCTWGSKEMHRSLRRGGAAALLTGSLLAAAALAGAALGGPALAAEPTPTPAEPTSGSDVLTLRGVIADPVTTHYLFVESLAGPTGSSNLLSGAFEAATDGSFVLELVRPQTTGEISVTIVEAPDAATTTVDEQGCTTSRVRGATLRFESAEAVAAGPVTVRLAETYESGLCPPAVGTPGVGTAAGSDASAGVGTTAQGETAAQGGTTTQGEATALPSPAATSELAQAVLGVTATPPPTAATTEEPPPEDHLPLWLSIAGVAVVVLGGLLARRRRSGPASEPIATTKEA